MQEGKKYDEATEDELRRNDKSNSKTVDEEDKDGEDMKINENVCHHSTNTISHTLIHMPIDNNKPKINIH